MKKILRIENVEKSYGKSKSLVKAVNGISLDINEKEFVGIMGPSGSGKTTLLNLISTIDTVSSGNIFVGDEDITTIKEKHIAKFRRENLGFIFQDFNLLDTLTVHENIALALTIQGKSSDKIDPLIEDIASKLGIESILNRYPYEISGGQKQRTACARAVITEPKLVLADEPTGALDSKSAHQLLDTMMSLNEDLGATILMVTHDAFSASYCERILFIKDGNIFTEILKGDKSRQEFFNDIMDVLTMLGGEVSHVR